MYWVWFQKEGSSYLEFGIERGVGERHWRGVVGEEDGCSISCGVDSIIVPSWRRRRGDALTSLLSNGQTLLWTTKYSFLWSDKFANCPGNVWVGTKCLIT